MNDGHFIRNASIGDLELLSELFDQYRVFYNEKSDPAGAYQFLRERIVLNQSQIFISSVADHTVTGFVQLYPSFSSTRMKRLWILNDLFVREQFRGQGISIALIDRAKEWCKQTKACALVLETTKSNEIGNNLYQQCGFTKDDQHNYYEFVV